MKKDKKQSKSKGEYYKLNKKTVGYIVFAIVAVIVILLGLYYSGIFKDLGVEIDLDTKQDKVKTDNFTVKIGKPEVDLFVIENPDCQECINVSKVIGIIKGAPTLDVVSDKTVAYDSEEGKELIAEYDLKRLPAFVMKIASDTNFEGDLPPFEKRNGDLVFDETPPPYYAVKDGQVKGIVKVTKIVNPDCEECFDLDLLMNNLRTFGVYIDEEETIAYDTADGQELVEKYGIDKVPTLLFSGDAAEYEQIAQVWKTIGTVEDDGTMVLRQVNPPYYSIEDSAVKGIVDITFVVDDSCEECYDLTQLQDMFTKQLAMQFNIEKTVDVSTAEGMDLVDEYNITKVPTLILSEGASEYPGLVTAWSQIGDVVDGRYVLTKIDAVPNAVYKNLETDEIIGLKEEDSAADDSGGIAEEGSEDGNQTS